ncbi:NAD(P)H nitroreductase [Shewanella nanhaiensis]|uniref:Putative NAD(P)H nitroreductase n=1 Tax=Shewanella nanhaiensis TaxID=2864872 RepID=A0ABS7E3Z8_9GAMM|nr:NAD(P)H nitroreductase [Shewanella nanhaiensis]MBW8183762.1 NAD(P)H nitroreductase [Shewanella nanhaiensis]
MDAIELLLTRQSCPRLAEPGPSEAQLNTILDAGVRVPDHAGLTPWEFIIAQGEGLKKLGQVFADAAMSSGADEAALAKALVMPQRAPLVIVVVAKSVEHAKVPELEQHIAAGCATMAMQQAAFALGLGAIWRTGSYAFDRKVHQSLGLTQSDQIVGFLYVGTPVVKAPIKAAKKGSEFTRYL